MTPIYLQNVEEEGSEVIVWAFLSLSFSLKKNKPKIEWLSDGKKLLIKNDLRRHTLIVWLHLRNKCQLLHNY
jgi:hypothetical protein